jgi:hypothetical protein
MSEESYDREQSQLRGDEDSEEQIQIKPPSMPEVNPQVYRDVEPILFRGFLTAPATINGVYFVFKSLNHHELEMVRLLSGVPRGEAYNQRFWNLFLAYAVFIVEDQNVLTDREKWIPSITKTFAELFRSSREHMVRHIAELNRKSSVASLLTECFSMETSSRFRWAQLSGLDLCSSSVTGIPGTSTLGLNWSQMMWRALNQYEDLNMRFERDWENAKFVGSCFAGKGLSKVYSQDNRRRKKETEDKISRRDRLLRHVFEGAPLEDKSTYRDGRVVMAARTVEELAEQVERDLRGEKDWHDSVVQEHEQMIQNKFVDQKKMLHEMYQNRSDVFDHHSVVSENAVQSVSPEELQERLVRQKQIEAQSLSRMQENPQMFDERIQNHLSKWGIMNEEGVPVQGLPPDREKTKPFKR